MLKNVQLEEAQDILLSLATPLPGETVPLLQALGRVAARDLYARQNLPFCPQAVVDGYAVCAGDEGDSLGYVVKERLSPGKIATAPLACGQAAYVATGCDLPEGATAVIPHEIARLAEERVFFTEEIVPNDNIQAAGRGFPGRRPAGSPRHTSHSRHHQRTGGISGRILSRFSGAPG